MTTGRQKNPSARVVVDLERDRRASLVGKACAERPQLGREVESPQVAYEKAGALRSPDIIASPARQPAPLPASKPAKLLLL